MSSRISPIPLVAANWKMNPNDAGDALDLVRGVLSVARGHAERVEVAIFPPFVWLTGVAEIRDFSDGTKAVGEAIANSGGYSLVGGGDTVAAIELLGLTGFSHVSTGGGATLEYLEGKELPGIAILKEA